MAKAVSVTQKLFLGVFLFLSLVSVGDAATGIDWLTAQQDPYGAYSTTNDIATSTQSTAEALTVIKLQSPPLAGVDPYAALNFLNAVAEKSTELLSRKIIAHVQAGNDASLYINELVVMQNEDGGFGESQGYDSTVLDTAYALKAFSVGNYNNPNVISQAIGFITSHQNTDGGFSHSNSNGSSIFITAISVSALQSYILTYSTGSQINNANQYLIQNALQIALPVANMDIALALIAVIPATTDANLYTDAVNQLRTNQLTNGSWENDVYITSLALHALHLADNRPVPVDPALTILMGKVVTQTTDMPLAGVQVSINSSPAIQAISGSDGSFRLIDAPSGQYTATYQATGYFSVTQQVTVVAGQVIDLGTVPISVIPDTGVIEGYVLDVATGLPVIGASVSITGSTTAQTTVDVSGYYRLALLRGAVTITAAAAGYQASSASATAVAGSSAGLAA